MEIGYYGSAQSGWMYVLTASIYSQYVDLIHFNNNDFLHLYDCVLL